MILQKMSPSSYSDYIYSHLKYVATIAGLRSLIRVYLWWYIYGGIYVLCDGTESFI